MKDKILFYAYLGLILLFTTVHNIYFLLFSLVLVLIISKKDIYYLLKKTLLSVFLFSFVVSLSYLVTGLFKEIDYSFLALFNIRVFLLTYMSFWVLENVNIFKVLPERKAILVALSFSQIYHYKNSFLDFWLGIRSRWSKVTYLKWIKSLKAMIFYFLNKSLHTGFEMNMGMRSRGFFDD